MSTRPARRTNTARADLTTTLDEAQGENKAAISICNDDDDAIEQHLLSMCKVDSQFAASKLQGIESVRSQLLCKAESLRVRFEKREGITGRIESRIASKQAELADLMDKRTASVDKGDLISTRVRDVTNKISNLGFVEREQVARLTQLNEMFGAETAAKSRVAMLSMMSHWICPSKPISYKLEEYRTEYFGYVQTLTWRTPKFRIGWEHHGIKRESLTEFGPFDVVMYRTFSVNRGPNASVSGFVYLPDVPGLAYDGPDASEVSHIPYERVPYVNSRDTLFPTEALDAQTRHLEDVPSALPTAIANNSGYFHPHISTGGRICLGNSQADILELMKMGDYPGVIQAAMNALTQYNFRDPYRRMDNFEPAVRDDNYQYECRICERILLRCECRTSSVTGQPVDVGEYLSPCGCTFNECLTHHERHGLNGGINGTSCFPSRHSKTYPQSVPQNGNYPVAEKVNVFVKAVADLSGERLQRFFRLATGHTEIRRSG